MAVHHNTRHEWVALPRSVQNTVEAHRASTVITAQTQPGGFTSGVAAVLEFDDGSKAFVKAVRSDDHMADEYRQEAIVAPQLPTSLRAPRLQLSFEHVGWVVLMFDAVSGRLPTSPWRDSELTKAVSAISSLADVLTPSPVRSVPTMEELMAGEFSTFRQLMRDGRSGPINVASLDLAVRSLLPVLASLESDWATLNAGETLTHFDLRSDNLILDVDDAVWIVDWSSPCLAAPWVDIVTFLPTVGRRPEEIESLFLTTSPGRHAPSDAVNALLAALTGMWFERSGHPAPAHVPHLRDHQRKCGRAAFAWLALRCG